MSAKTPRQIAFDDIKKGDDIEARYTRDGVVYTCRGIAYETNSHRLPEYWYSEAGGVVANNYDGNWKHFLHARPAPAEPRGLGAVVRARVPASGGGLWTFVQVLVEQGLAPWQGPGTWRFYWSNFDPDSIEVLSEGIEVDQ